MIVGREPGARQPILLVDDEPANLEMLERFLRRRYAPIYRAGDGAEALEVLERHTVHLILSDQRMPRMDGVELFRRALEVQPEAIRVLVTGYSDVEAVLAAINAGHAYQYVTKPIDLKALDVTITRALEAYDSAVRERQLFECFVRAAVTAIEQRDPSTAGHSTRVANLTVGFARALDGLSSGPFAAQRFSRDDLEQLRFAGLLHDFGKIGVREHVLVKSHKLPPERLELILVRIEHATKSGQLPAEEVPAVRTALLTLNDPGTNPALHDGLFAVLAGAGVIAASDEDYLRITHGSLSPAERGEIEAHVQHTVRFLEQIPWPPRLERVVVIAGGHHEKMNGRGYPRGDAELPVETRMMTISDIYDALTAADRPYKTALPHAAALDVLSSGVQRGELDPQLFTIFLEHRIFELAR